MNSELKNQVVELKKQIEISHLKSSIQSEEEANRADELIRAKEKIEESEKELKYSQRIAQIGYYILDIEKDIWTSSEIFDDIFGIDERFTRNSESWIRLIHPEFKSEMINYLSTNILDKHEQFNKQYKIINKKTNSVIWVHGVGTLEFNTKGELIKMFGTVQDITAQMQTKNELLENQKRYEKSQELGHVGNWDYNFKSDEFWVSNESKRIYGFDLDSNNFNIEQIESCIPERDRVHRALIDLLDNGKEYNLEFEIIPADKSPRKIIRSIAELETDKNNNPLRVRGVILDITEQKKAEQLLRESNASKDKLFSIIAHDLRSPFNSIIGFTELLIENTKEFKDSKFEKYLGIIDSAAHNTLILLNNLLNWAKSESGKIYFQPEKLILSSIIQEIFTLSNSIAHKKNIILNYHELEEITVFADQNMIKTILRNLISNAIKFTNSYGKIDVYASQVDEFIEIAVSDNGVGIDEETQKKMFSLSSNESTNGTANEKGTGLGLILCKDFVEKHGGTIWVESKLDKGSTFTFKLPTFKIKTA